MNISTLLQSLPKLKSENITSSTHFNIRFEERKDDVMPDIDGIHKMLISSDPVAISNQEGEKFEILFNLNEDYDLALVVSVKDTNPEIIIRLITCYKKERKRRVK
ncbi:hypothetical protein [Methanogenium organophilum]|uniref:Uncharacterized protein n=1 Tax=Methanogenium organophilum TaxID=2199 RepID=A0A9X9T7V9_METOG|nr:hypothetical protein [Methanogenium organophilum]WAI01105.1 hypothetical protein OU421_11885 [Methanogenium organophilum]